MTIHVGFWEWFIWIIVLGVYGRVIIWAHYKANRYAEEFRERKFLKHLKIEYPDSVITLSSVEASSKAALDNIKEQLDAGAL